MNNEESLKKITNSYLNQLPNLQGHNEVKTYLEKEFVRRFVFYKNIEDDNGVVSYLYHLILDRVLYDKGIPKLKGRKWSLTDDDCYNFIFSYQTVEIEEDGTVHFH